MHYILATNTRRSGIRNSRKASYKTKLSFRMSWLLVGIVLGTAITSFTMFKLKDADIKFSLNKPQNKTKLAQAKPKFQSQSQFQSQQKSKPKSLKPKFEFYNELTKSQNQPTLDLGLKKSDKSPTIYTIQAGSFNNKNDAEQFKAELALKGFDANLNMVTLKTGQKWYRVNIGAFQSAQELAVQKKLLAEHNIDSSLVTILTMEHE